jgi:hypothetical protein
MDPVTSMGSPRLAARRPITAALTDGAAAAAAAVVDMIVAGIGTPHGGA